MQRVQSVLCHRAFIHRYFRHPLWIFLTNKIMCILFLWTTGKDGRGQDGKGDYKLILGANRDEKYSRPSKISHFWPPQCHIIGGQDGEPGKEGGTWLGMNRDQGKIGALLNMPPKPSSSLTTSTSNNSERKLGRGFLVTNYLTSNLTGFEYATQLKRQNAAERYHSFNLLTVDLVNGKENEPEIYYFSNYSPKLDPANPSSLTDHFGIKLKADQVHSFGNSPYTSPFLKVRDGHVKFENLIRTYTKKNDEDNLISGVLKILKSTERHYPDPAMSKMADARSTEFAQGISSRFVHIPWNNYGSRTHTIILVDASNNVKYLEWTLTEPIIDPLRSAWVETAHEFQITDKYPY